jgi:hypothetical protein
VRDETIWLVFQSINTAAVPIAWRLTDADALACIQALKETAKPGTSPLLWVIPVTNTICEVVQ